MMGQAQVSIAVGGAAVLDQEVDVDGAGLFFVALFALGTSASPVVQSLPEWGCRTCFKLP